jgi:hypothetical protein
VNGDLPLRGHATAAALRAGMLAVLLVAPPAWAFLGGGVADVQGEQLRMRATRAVATTFQPGSVHELRLADGSSIRQYINAQGVVYAVAWSTRVKPDFTQLLGRYAADFDAGVAAVLRTPGIKRSAVIDQGDLVVQSGGRQGAFVGKAWLKSQLPTGTSANAIR